MLRNYLISLPNTKFVVIEDSLQERGKQIFDFLLNKHLERSPNTIHYLVFQDNYDRVKKRFNLNNNVVVHDFVSNIEGWDDERKCENVGSIIGSLGNNDVVFVDSLAHCIYYNGLVETYGLFSTLKNQAGVLQIVALLHIDLLEKTTKADKLFEHLCTLSIILLPKFYSDYRRAHYTYKKLGGKIIKQTEEYWFEGEDFNTKKIEKLDPKKLLETSFVDKINPENLTTFKIGLTDKDKESRDQLVLPYLPKFEAEKPEESGQIFYKFDEVDDWDEEDPDDDLDI